MSASLPLALTPGAPRAKEAGCLCPVMDNGHGRGMGRDHKGVMLYVIREDCPMHGSPAPSAKPCVNCDGHQTCERCGGSGGGPDLPHRCISCDGTGRCYLCAPPSAPAMRRGEKGDDRG